MAEAKYQTTRLARGRHRSPDDGVCAMELSSLLAGEHFSDHPQQVCPVIAAFLRGYNDALTPELRNELYGIAASVVGSRTPDPELRRERAVELLKWTVGVWEGKRVRLPWPPSFTPVNGFGDLEEAGAYVGRFARRHRDVHERTVAFVEALAQPPVTPAEPPPAPAPTPPAAPEPSAA